ncbi:MAG: helix-turn-helix domain-containing protein [Solirubrobacterales bacterium]|nr:helix-turn-helix domain-containing protein [Solirubrobacterales bacterium]
MSQSEQIRRLLELAFSWVPYPRTRPLEAMAGFAGGTDEHGRALRWLTCPDCLANGRTMPGCETCSGRGEIADPGPDPMENRSAVAIGGLEQVRKYERQHERDRTLARLERLLGDPESQAGGDSMTYAVEQFERLCRGSSLAELVHALDRLQSERPWLYDALWLTFERPFDEHVLPLRESLERAVDEGIALLEGWLPDELRVPEWALLGEVSQMAGKGRWANDAQQRRRNREIRALAQQGLGTREIARRVGLDHAQVSRILAGERASA